MECTFCNGDRINDITTKMIQPNNMLLVIKNVPCLKCTQCGEPYFDYKTAGEKGYISKIFEDTGAEMVVVEYNKVMNLK